MANQIRIDSLEDIMADRFSRYAKYIIQERALPDARDGLKPVQRRILYAMYEAHNTPDRPYHKSAKTVGNVIGNYHPHGDISVYDAMVRLSQNWKLNTPLVDMQGNNGSIDDDPPAAMRYTEARLASLSMSLLADIEKDTVSWAPNFSDEKLEPTVLPASFPNLLAMGATGIAAGYATNIPPHNLSELIDATIYRMNHSDCQVEDLMEIVQGPDFPTGGIVMGKEGIVSAFKTGKGRLTIRAKVAIEKTRTIQQLVVSEIPYEVNKSQMVKRIDDLRLDKKIDGLLDVRDESDRTGLRVVIDLKKEADASAILNYLYKNTDLQVNYSYNMIAIVDKAPVQMSLDKALDVFIQYRRQVIYDRTTYIYAQKSQRAHIVDGLVKAMSILDEVIACIRQSENKADAQRQLADQFGFSDAQAEAIVSMRLYRLTNTDVFALIQEAQKLAQELANLQEILDKPHVLDDVLIGELAAVQRQFGQERKTEITEAEAELVIDPKAMIAQEEVTVTISKAGYVKRVSQRSVQASNGPTGLKEGDQLIAQGSVMTHDTLLVITSRGLYGYVPVYQLQEARWKDLGNHLSTYFKLVGADEIIAAYVLPEFYEGISLVCGSANGQIKRVNVAQLEMSRMNKATRLMKIGDLDRLVIADISVQPSDEILLVTKQGMGIRYALTDIPEQGLTSKGVSSARLSNLDEVADGIIITGDQFIIRTADDLAKRMNVDQVNLVNRPAKGVRLAKVVKSSPQVIEEVRMVEEFGKQIPLMESTATYSSKGGPWPEKRLRRLEPGHWTGPKESFEQGQLVGLD